MLVMFPWSWKSSVDKVLYDFKYRKFRDTPKTSFLAPDSPGIVCPPSMFKEASESQCEDGQPFGRREITGNEYWSALGKEIL